MKLPDLKSPFRGGRPGGSSAGPKPPKLLGDLYADLRDRRLLPLVALLIVAIVATPFLLSEGDGEELVEAPTAVTAAPVAQADFSVVPAQATLRDYRKRLGYREPRDPFGADSGSHRSSEDAGVEPIEPAESTSPEAALEPIESDSGVESSAPQITETHITKKAEVTVKAQLTGLGVNAKLGYLGHLKEEEKIRPTTRLPNAKHPVVVYMGPTQDKKGALFLMTSNVTAYYGGGRCALPGQVCQLLELKPGQSATFAYGYGGARYKLVLKKFVPLIKQIKVEKHFSSE